ncbi:hypothetical protein [Protofrankia coriariae]|uniref:EspG family protein n=1 Tax=Protofrankia coriariae TaxID=1562887 RepID=A0ABR5F3L6_9ACTN|nr:hypothetical protein [Protofrankia coriariae]KLL11327.1 hypothetical protein FrCorBMG51_11960 [Protofrankia coriariae]
MTKKPPTAVRLTGDELTAIARCLGARRFPHVPYSGYNEIDEELHPLLDDELLAGLAARGLVDVHADGELRLAGPLASVVGAVAAGRVHIAVEQIRPAGDPGTTRACALVAGDRGLVRHWSDGPLHDLEHDPDTHALDVRLRVTLSDLVNPSPGTGRPGRRRLRATERRLADALPAPADGWRRVTVLARTDDAGDDARVDGLLAVFDGGPGELWLGHCEDADAADGNAALTMVADPVSAAGVDAAIREFTSIHHA